MAFEESGTENTQSAPEAGCSRASSRPRARRTRSTERWKTVLSGREKYTSSKMQRCCGLAGSRGRSSSSSPCRRKNSPGSTSRYGVAPMMSSAHVSDATRSEEHTSELQSRLHLVCRLLLEKKKKHTDKRTMSMRHQIH